MDFLGANWEGSKTTKHAEIAAIREFPNFRLAIGVRASHPSPYLRRNLRLRYCKSKPKYAV